MVLFHSSNWGSDSSVLYMGNNGQQVPQSLQSTYCYPPKTPSTHSVTSLTITLRCSWPEICQGLLSHRHPAVPLQPCRKPRPGVPHVPKFAKWINMDLWCNCGPILTSEAHLIMLLARYLSLRHTQWTCSFIPCCCFNPFAPGG